MEIEKTHGFFSPGPYWQNEGLLFVRVVTGFFLVYHGWEVFDASKMNEYVQWDAFKNHSGKALVYAGKLSELISGFLLAFGLGTRVAALMIISTLSYIAFFVGHGKIWYEDQHPFMFVLVGMVFLFTGPGSISLDAIINNRINRTT